MFLFISIYMNWNTISACTMICSPKNFRLGASSNLLNTFLYFFIFFLYLTLRNVNSFIPTFSSRNGAIEVQRFSIQKIKSRRAVFNLNLVNYFHKRNIDNEDKNIRGEYLQIFNHLSSNDNEEGEKYLSKKSDTRLNLRTTKDKERQKLKEVSFEDYRSSSSRSEKSISRKGKLRNSILQAAVISTAALTSPTIPGLNNNKVQTINNNMELDLWKQKGQANSKSSWIKPNAANAIGSLPEFEENKSFLQHLVFNVPDIEEAVNFYTVGLGMKILRSRKVDGGLNSTFVGYGPETLNKTAISKDSYFAPGVSSFDFYGGHLAIELNEMAPFQPDGTPTSRQLHAIPGNSLAFLQIALPQTKFRVSKLLAAGGNIIYSYGWFLAISPFGVAHQIIIGERRDPLMFAALNVQNVAASKKYYTEVLNLKEIEFPLARQPGSVFEPPPPKGSTYLAYDKDGFGLLLLNGKGNKVNTGTIFDKVAIVSTDVVEKGNKNNAVFAGAVPGIGTRVAVLKDPDGRADVLVEYEDFEKELPNLEIAQF